MKNKEGKHKDKDANLVDVLIDKSTTAAAIAEPEEFAAEESAVKLTRHHKLVRHRNTTCLEQTANCMKTFLLYMLSYVGLTCTVVAYSILGGVVFVALESENEVNVQNKATQLREEFLKYIEREVNMTVHMRINYNQTWRGSDGKSIAEHVRDFQQNTFQLVNKEGWTGVDDVSEGDPKWTFAGGLLYAVTVITTIGYGFITPKTLAGQAITMVYALIGIPLTILCLSTIGKGMASLFRALYGRTFCVECRQQFLLTVRARRASSVSAEKIELNQKDNQENGIADIVPETRVYHEHGEVPIIICLVLVVWYIVFGAIMFTIWEPNWSLFTGAYFCFITLSTIGFGDIVPGLSHKDWDDQVKQVACSLYLLIGLSTLAMCFDLMQQRGRSLANRLATFVGLVNKH